MATSLQKGLFGGDPMEAQREQQKMWSTLYGQAGSPYEKMGIALGQLGGAIFGGESAATGKANAINKALEQAGSQYQQGTAEYYKAISDALPSEYADSKEFALQKYAEIKKAEDAVFNESSKNISDRPDTYEVLAAPLASALVAKAKANGYDESTPLPTTSKEISAFAKEYGLVKDPMYGKLISLTKTYETAVEDKTRKAEHEALTMKGIESTINRNNREVSKLEKDAKFDAGDRWNAEREAAITLFAANKIDPTQPLKGINLANTELVNAQKIALRQPFTGKANATITPPGSNTSPIGGPKPGQYQPTAQDLQAASWLQANPNSPDAAAVKSKLKAKGMQF